MSRLTSDTSEQIRLLCLDEHAIVLAGLGALLNAQPDMRVVGSATTGHQGIEEFRSVRPDVTLMDLRFRDMSGIDAIAAIRRESPDARIVVLTMFEGDVDAQRALDAGAQGYLFKSMRQHDLFDTIRAVHSGTACVPPDIAARIAAYQGYEVLTLRELDVLQLVADGGHNAEIATQLGIKEETVKAHIRTILGKLGAHSRAHAVTIAIRRGFISTWSSSTT
jgi:two-component system NarL family response regulator